MSSSQLLTEKIYHTNGVLSIPEMGETDSKNPTGPLKKVYHNGVYPFGGEVLHNVVGYVNKCNQIHKGLCFVTDGRGIFGGEVDIIIQT